MLEISLDSSDSSSQLIVKILLSTLFFVEHIILITNMLYSSQTAKIIRKFTNIVIVRYLTDLLVELLSSLSWYTYIFINY